MKGRPANFPGPVKQQLLDIFEETARAKVAVTNSITDTVMLSKTYPGLGPVRWRLETINGKLQDVMKLLSDKLK